MRHLKKYKLFESDNIYSDRDKTNMYHCSLGWVRYEFYEDVYDEIQTEYNISSSEIGDLLEEIVENCNLLYKCVPGTRNHIITHNVLAIHFFPNVDLNKFVDYKLHIKPKIDDGSLFKMLDSLENKLSDFYPNLTIITPRINTIKEDKSPIWLKTGYGFFMTTSQFLLKIRKI